jgi:hypothetical protein
MFTETYTLIFIFMHVYSDMLNKLVPHEMISLKSVDEWQQVFNMNMYFQMWSVCDPCKIVW